MKLIITLLIAQRILSGPSHNLPKNGHYAANQKARKGSVLKFLVQRGRYAADWEQ